ncbi:MAG TPA: helix-turn-helix domain-containing protein [Proteiniclasticum sp.]|nr:helix-turn-helix domain-containing protein [Proteiniclasticum sp.]
MGRKSNSSYETKLQAVQSYLSGEGSYISIGEQYGISKSRVSLYVKKYQSEGPQSLQTSHRNQQYSQEFKLKVVLEYLDGGIGISDLSVKYGIKSDSQVSNWVGLYNSGKNFKSYKSGGTTIMNKGRKTTHDERIKIVEDCLRSGLDYQATAEKYKVSFQQVYSWIKKYQKEGVTGLKDGRGKPKDIGKMDEVERLKAENQLLKAQLERMKVEDMLKKKVDELRFDLDITRKRKK